MHLTPSDPDVATLYRKIKQGRLDLQPNFQRGEVWGKIKKQRLIDSILRGWHIPPVHVIQVPNSDKQEVLDGQQRLAAIRDFMEGEFAINGNQDPQEKYIMELDGLTWDKLPNEIAIKIEDFTIRVLTISDYKPGEPGELFYRLNQPTNLTSAEQRNAYFGEARQQVKALSEYMASFGFNRETLGYSNSRMAYDDVISKFLLTLEIGTLKKKITANTVTSRYRDTIGFESQLVDATEDVLKLFSKCILLDVGEVKLNKASTLSWMLFIYSYKKYFCNDSRLEEYFRYFESIKGGIKTSDSPIIVPKGVTRNLINKVLDVYQDRASSRVADTSSVILRDLSLWIVYTLKYPEDADRENHLHKVYRATHHLASLNISSLTEKDFEIIANKVSWGESL